MEKFLLNLLIPVLTFAIGVEIYKISSSNLSIQAISDYTSFYDGMNVQIETYAQLASYDEREWYLGEPFEKKELFTYLDLENNSTNLSSLHSQLKENYSKQKFKRVRVLVRGTVKDDCQTNAGDGAKISFGCCFGRTITIKAQEVIQLEPVEDYTLPE
jgi:hypothetical protein